MRLWHGTRATQPDEIALGTGFNVIYSSAEGMWGNGLYFA